MLNKTVLSITTLSVFVVLVFTPMQADACLCVPMSVKKRVKKMKIEAEAILTGRVESLDISQDNENGLRTNRAVLSVDRVWKSGSIASSTVSIYTSGGCGVGFEVAKTYLVFAKLQPDGRLYTDVCMGTGNITLSEKDLKYLGKPIETHFTDQVKLSLTVTALPPFDLFLAPFDNLNSSRWASVSGTCMADLGHNLDRDFTAIQVKDTSNTLNR
jgi:hypothetical protein